MVQLARSGESSATVPTRGTDRGAPGRGSGREDLVSPYDRAGEMHGELAPSDVQGGDSAVSISPTAWAASGDLSLLEWSHSGRRLGVIGRAAGWWIGDWLNYGNARFGERYVRAARITGYDVQTLMNMVYVASRFEPSRRRDNLSWSHHAELAALEPEKQDHWLER